MSVQLSVRSANTEDDLVALAEWLRAERELQGHIRQLRRPIAEGELGGAFEMIAVPVGNGRVFSEPCETTTDGNGSASCDDVRYDVPGADVYEYVETSDGVIKSNVIHWERR